MNRIDRCELALSKGYKYDKETGVITNIYGKQINCKHSHGYVYMSFYHNKKQYRLLGHHFAWYFMNGAFEGELDHVNGDKSDNRISNLRNVSRQLNCWNMVNAKGYYYSERDKLFYAQITVNRKVIKLGSFKNKEEAASAYMRAKSIHHVIN